MKKLRLLLLLAVAAIAACEKEDTTEWGQIDKIVRAYSNFDATIVPSLLTRGVAKCTSCTIQGMAGTDGLIILHSAMIFHADGKVWEFVAPVPPKTNYVLETAWEYVPETRTIVYGKNTRLVVKAVVSDTELIVEEALTMAHGDGTLFERPARSVLRILTDEASLERYRQQYESLEKVEE